MKSTNLLTIILLLVSISGISQELTISAGPSWGVPMYYQVVSGGASYAPLTGVNANVTYVFQSDKKLSWGISTGYQKNNVETTPEFTGEVDERTPFSGNCDILYVSPKMLFLKREKSNFSFNLLMSLQLNTVDNTSISEQTGMGLGISYVQKFKIGEKSYLILEPIISVFNIVPFKGFDMTQRMTSIGLNIGMGTKLSK